MLTAPLGLIGVTLFLLVFNVPFGFVAMLGTIALFGMIMRNSVILVDQIEQDIAAGQRPWDAIIDATVRRFRPIVLTALRGDPRDDSADAQRVLRPDGGGDHGRIVRRDGTDAAVPAGTVRGVVPRAPCACSAHGDAGADGGNSRFSLSAKRCAARGKRFE